MHDNYCQQFDLFSFKNISLFFFISQVPNFCNLRFSVKNHFVFLPFWSYVFVRLYSIAILKLVVFLSRKKLFLVVNPSKLVSFFYEIINLFCIMHFSFLL